MAGLRGNIAWLAGAKQTARGTPATLVAPTGFKNAFSGGSIGPVRESDNLAETDSSRDRGVSYITTSGVEGEPEVYVRDSSIVFWLRNALGSLATAGTTPNFTHTVTPSNSLPYVTLWRDIADTLYEQYQDCKVSSLNISAEAGAPLTATIGVQGLQATRLTVAPDNAAVVPIENSAVYNYNDATVTLGGGATALVRSFELGIDNNVTRQQTDNVIPYDLVEGTREVTLGFDLIFETLTEYNQFHYGGAAGTVISPNIYTTSAAFSFDKGTNNSVAFNLPSIAYEEFPVEPDAGGDPVTVSVRAVAQRGASPVVTATVKNQTAGTAY
jgi:hypothetical protein